jgi:hypothetical protein
VPREHEQLVARLDVRDASRSVLPAVTMFSLSWLNDTSVSAFVWPGRLALRPQSLVRQMRAAPSLLAVATNSPSGLNAIATGFPACSRNVWMRRPL